MRYYERITDDAGVTHLRFAGDYQQLPFCMGSYIIMTRERLQLESIDFGLVSCATCQSAAESEMDAFQTRVIQQEQRTRERATRASMEGKRVY